MAKKKRPKQPSGAAKMYAAGKRPILLGVTPSDKAKLERAAALLMRSVAGFIVFYALQAADEVLVAAEEER